MGRSSTVVALMLPLSPPSPPHRFLLPRPRATVAPSLALLLRTKMITAGCLAGVSDSVAQKLSGYQRIEKRRLLLKIILDVPSVWGRLMLVDMAGSEDIEAAGQTGFEAKMQVLRTAVGHRLAKVQGYLFMVAFLRRVPTFTRLIIENLLLCFLQSAIYQTSKYLTGSLGLHFKKILTDLVHADYFENMVYYKISHVDHRISNPEQRIASDIPKFCSELSGLVQDDLTAVADGFIYIWRLCSYASPKYVLWILVRLEVMGKKAKNATYISGNEAGKISREVAEVEKWCPLVFLGVFEESI